jgi:hypothetical protein
MNKSPISEPQQGSRDRCAYHQVCMNQRAHTCCAVRGVILVFPSAVLAQLWPLDFGCNTQFH